MVAAGGRGGGADWRDNDLLLLVREYPEPLLRETLVVGTIRWGFMSFYCPEGERTDVALGNKTGRALPGGQYLARGWD